jgi:hypothetical protein
MTAPLRLSTARKDGFFSLGCWMLDFSDQRAGAKYPEELKSTLV